MKKQTKTLSFKKGLKLMIVASFVGLIVYLPVLYRFVVHGIIYSGNGDGFKQMMPFQMFLYDRFSHFKSFYDLSLGLGGDYFTDLAYYYATSPMMYFNFLFVALGQWLFHMHPQGIAFWPENQIFTAYLRCIMTFIAAYGMFRAFNFKRYERYLGAFLYASSSVVYYFNFTWSFFGDILIYLPLSIWGMERFFRSRKIGLFIIAITLTLYSNFYFSYYELIGLTVYLIYRMIHTHPKDCVTRWQKLYLLIPATIISFCIASIGFITGVRSFLNNDRESNDVMISPIIDFSQKYHIFTNGFYITVTFIAFVALCSFKLYRHYEYKMFAVLTWLLLIGSLSPYFDSVFNGFSFPQRRWVYFLALTTSALITLWIKYFNELTRRDFLQSLIPIILLAITTLLFSRGAMWWMIVSIIILIILSHYALKQKKLTQNMRWIILILFVVQQFVLLIDYHHNNIAPYQSTMKDLQAAKYHSPTLQREINQIKQHQTSIGRIDYMDPYAVNSSLIYRFNGVALYSSIFDGRILQYYDKEMQINMEYDSNSTYRLLGDRANLYALWGVSDRIKKAPDTLLPYGMQPENDIKDGKTTWAHAKNLIQYPSAHLTNKVYNPDDLKSPLDREQAMLQGVVMPDTKANQSFEPNPNFVSKATIQPRDATLNKDHLSVHKKDGGVNIQIPHQQHSAFKDYYIEMDVELLSPSQPHYLKVDDFYQRRTSLNYAYRRFVTPVTVRVPAKDTVQVKLKQGKYRFRIKGIYGENYQTLKKAQKNVQPVRIERGAQQLKAHFNSNQAQYLVLPIPYREGLSAEAHGESRVVKQGNGLMTVIPVQKGDTEVTLHYALPYWKTLTGLTLIGLISALLYRKWLRKTGKTH